jgi:hypothetical protein
MANVGTKSIKYSTDYNLKTLDLITNVTGTGTVNLLPYMIELSLFEDIYSSTISGEVLISDAIGIISNYRLNGTEFIQVQLQKSTEDPRTISRNYRVYKIGKRVTGDNNDYEVYSLNFCSEEFLISEQYRLSKSFPQTKISDVITSILTDYVKVGNKKLAIEETDGPHDFVLPNKKLFETINWLSTYAKSKKSSFYGDMLFFENSEGYFFNSLQSLYGQDSYQTFKFDPKNITDQNMNQKITNASDFEVLSFFDVLSAISNGTFANKLITIDPLLRTSNTDIVFNYNDYFKQSVKMNKGPLINNYKNRLGQTLYDREPTTPAGLEMGTLRLASTNKEERKNAYVTSQKGGADSASNDIYIEKYLTNRVAQLAIANYMKIKITVPGDPGLSAGKTVTFNTFQIQPSSYSQSGERPLDPFYSGKYLVSAVRHIVKNSSYITVLELCKESVGTAYPGYNAGALDNYVKGNQI